MKHTVDTMEVESGWMALKGHDPNRRMAKGTLVIGDERVFTESEVRAMLKDYNAAIYDPGLFARRRLGEPLPQWTEAAQTAALAKHGVSLDPA